MFARSEYHWVERPHPLLGLLNLWHRLVNWLDGLEQAHPLAFWVLLGGLTAVLLALLAHVGYVVWRIARPTAQTGDAGAGTGGAGAGLEDAQAHLARAEALARAGRYAEALAQRFLAAVLQLEEARAVAFHPSKTPAEYVSEVRLDDAGRATFTSLVAQLYRHLFGAVPCDEVEYREFGAAAERVTRHVVPA